MDDIMEKLNKKAQRFGATSFGLSRTKNKRFYVIYDNKRINFGSKTGQTYIGHHDKRKRNAWRARHSKILQDGQVAYKNKTSGEYWNWHLTW